MADDPPIDVGDAASAPIEGIPKIPSAPSEPSTFGAAFKAARAGGDKTFTWRGKSYNTSLASDAPKPKPKPAATASAPKAPPKPPAPPVRASTPAAPAKPRIVQRDPLNRAGIKPPETVGTGITVTAPKGTRARNAAQKRAAGYQSQARATIAKEQSMSERDKSLARRKEILGYAKGGKTNPFAKKGKKAPPFGKKVNPFGKKAGMAKANPFAAKGPTGPSPMPPMGKFAKGGAIDGCAKRGKTRCKKV